jgi:hypothetical protein
VRLPSRVVMVATLAALATWDASAPAEPATFNAGKLKVLVPGANGGTRRPRARPRPSLAASLPPVLTGDERRALFAAAATLAKLAPPPGSAPVTPKTITLSLDDLMDDDTDDELVLMSAAIVWPRTHAVVFADATQWPRLILHPHGPGKLLFVDCLVNGPGSYEVAVQEMAPGTIETNHDEAPQTRAATSQPLDAQNGHLFIPYLSSAKADDDTPVHMEITPVKNTAWLLFRCEVTRLN